MDWRSIFWITFFSILGFVLVGAILLGICEECKKAKQKRNAKNQRRPNLRQPYRRPFHGSVEEGIDLYYDVSQV